MMKTDAFRSSRTVLFLAGALALFGLYLTSLHSYLLFHSLAELFSIVVACGIFFICWNTRRLVNNSYFVIVGIAYLFVGIMDLIHALALPGMGVFPGSDTNLADQLWIAGRFVQSISLLLAPLFIARKLRADLVLAGYAVGVGHLFGATLYFGIFPVCSVEGVGLTPFKVISEYAISLILLASLALLYRRRKEFDAGVVRRLMASITVAIVSELAFTQYVHTYAMVNMIGHILKIISFYILYRAVVEIVVVNSHNLLFSDLKREQEALHRTTKRYEMATQAAKIGVWDWNIQTGRFYLDPNVKALLGYRDEEIPNDIDVWVNYVHPDDRQPVMEAAQAHIEGQTPEYSYEHRMLHKDGSDRWILSRGTAIRDAEGTVVRMVGTDADITERKRAEEQLRILTRHLEAVLNSAGDGIVGVDTQGAQTYVNPAAARMLGYDQSELIGRRSHRIWHHSTEDGTPQPEEACPIHHTLANGVVHEDEDVFWRKDGSSFPVEYVSTPILDDGELEGAVIAFRDVTERKRADEYLRESEEKFRTLAAESPNMILISREGDLVYANEMCEKVLGYTTRELCSPHFDSRVLVAPDSRRAIEENLPRHLREEVVPGIEYSLVTKEGKIFEALVATRLIRYEGETATLGVITDITERKRAEEELRRLMVAVEQSPSTVVISDSQGNIEYVNPKFTETTGYKKEEVLGGNPRLLQSGEHSPDFYDQLWGTILDGNEWRGEFVNRKKNGELYWELAAISPVRNSEGAIDHFIKVGEDITNRKYAELALQEAKATAEKAAREEQERRREAERRRGVADSLALIMNVLNSNQPLDEVLDYITSQAEQLLDNQAVVIYRFDDEGKLSVQAAQGLSHTYVVDQRALTGQQTLEQTIAYGKAMAVSNLCDGPANVGEPSQHAEDEALASRRDGPYKAMLTAPITLGDEPYGGIALYYSNPREFTEEEIELATVFADQIGLAVENARLRDQVREAAAIAERERLARDLHDAVTQTLFSASLIAESLPRIWERDPERGEEGLEELRELTQGALAEMRTLLLELRPAALADKPLGELLGHLTRAVTSRSRTPVTFTVDGDSSLPAAQQIALYRIAQEALNNVAKHAAATQVSVHLSCQPGRVALTIQDDGRGFGTSETLPDQLGLRFMRERAERIGAVLEIQSHPGQGTTIRVDWEEAARRQSNE